MNKIFFLLLLIPALFANAQKTSSLEVGLDLYVFEFIRINGSDIDYQKDKQNIPNGYGIGFTIEKNWNKKWGIKTGIDYSVQNEKCYMQSPDVHSLVTKYNYYKIPLSIQFFHKLNPKTYLAINQGIQFSLLSYFETVSTTHDMTTTITSSYVNSISNIDSEWNYFAYEDNSNNIHRNTLFGIVGSAGIKGVLSNKLSYSVNLRYEYDFSSADKIQYIDYPPISTNVINRNFRIGLALGLQYNITRDRKPTGTKCVEF
jgi:hypothetical protein